MRKNESDADIGEVIVEFMVMGPIVKVSAIHTASGREVTLQGPASAGPHVLKQQAVNKLKYVLQREKKS